jgi:hypothetical protein
MWLRADNKALLEPAAAMSKKTKTDKAAGAGNAVAGNPQGP